MPTTTEPNQLTEANAQLPRGRQASPMRAMLVVAIALVLAIAAVATNEIFSSHDTTYTNSRREIETVNLALANQTEQLFQAVELAVNGARNELQRLSGKERSDRTFIHRLLAAHVAAVPAVTNMGFIDAEGWLVAHSSAAAQPPSRFDDRPYFQTLRDETHDRLIIEEPSIGRISNKRLIFVVRRVADAQGNFLGVVIASIDTPWLVGMLRALTGFEGGTAAIFRADARLLARYPEVEGAYGRSYADLLLFTEHATKSPAGTYKAINTIDGKERFVSYRVLERYPIVVDVSVDESVLVGRWRASALRVGGSALIAAALVVMLFAVIYRQLHQLETQAQALRKQAHTDSLTGLPNRSLFEDRLERALAAAARKKRQVAVLFIDLDKFKEVNDTLGHAAGDLLLQQTATRFSACLREMDTVSRLGGDEFTVLLPELETTADAEAVAQKIIDAVGLPFNLAGKIVNITCSIGIAQFPDDADEASSLVRHADFAMYSAKQDGHNCFRRYSPSS
ncbi:MAG: hypothetical protein QG672_2300 [Pseudomonadota bacterium]|nr:hypothetical protein [Pseudomonadota bacterium]